MQGDYNVTQITATIYDKNKLYNIACNGVSVQGVTANGAVIAHSVDNYDEHTVTFTLTDNMLTSPGAMKLTLVFSGNDEQITTFPFIIIVTTKPTNELSKSEIDIFQSLVNKASEYAALSQSYAVGTENVTRNGDSTDNAKYYAEKSQKSSNNAKASANDSAESASDSATSATESKKWMNTANDYAEMAESFAVGTDNKKRAGDATDNAKYYYELVKKYVEENIDAYEIAYYDTYSAFQTDYDAGNIKAKTLVLIKEDTVSS